MKNEEEQEQEQDQEQSNAIIVEDNINEILIKANSSHSNSFLSNETKRSIITVKIILGQLLALLTVGIALFAKQIESQSIYAFPCLLNTGYYFAFAFIWLIYLKELTPPKAYFFIIILFDTQANFLKAYSYTASRFNYLFTAYSASIVFTYILSAIAVKKKHQCTISHISGITIALIGIALTTYGLIVNYPSVIKEIEDNYIGVLCALGYALCSSISFVLMDKYFTSGKEVYELFPWMGLCGTVISIVESFALNEYNKVSRDEIMNWGKMIWYLCFVASMVTVSTVAPFYIRKSSASMLNVSIVSQMAWAYLIDGVMAYEIIGSYLYYVGFIVIVVGLIVFNIEKGASYNNYNGKDIRSRGSTITDDGLTHKLLSTNSNTYSSGGCANNGNGIGNTNQSNGVCVGVANG